MDHGDHAGHGAMDHSAHMDHSNHAGMDHSNMDHGDHSGHMAADIVNTTMKAVMDMIQTTGAMDHSGHDHDHMDHAHMDHSQHMGHHTRMDMGGDGGGMDMGGDHGSMMMMYFHFGYSETILFSWWKINTIGGLVGSMVGIFILAMLYEGLKYWREHLFRKSLASMQYCAKVEKGNATEQDKPSQMNMLSLDHGIQTLLHVVQMVVSYFLMLIFMTYNAWLCIATVLGAAFGYFLFGWRKSVVVDITEHCH